MSWSNFGERRSSRIPQPLIRSGTALWYVPPLSTLYLVMLVGLRLSAKVERVRAAFLQPHGYMEEGEEQMEQEEQVAPQ